jgi:phosphonate transport system permease protein
VNSYITNKSRLDRFLINRKLITASFVAVVVIIFQVSSAFTDFSIISALRAIPRVLIWASANLVPTADALENLPKMISTLGVSVLASVMASVTAAIIAFPLSLMAAETTRINSVVASLVRGFASIVRNMPVAVWAMILIISFSMSSFTGYLALSLASMGFLTRAFIESIEESSSSSVEALRAVGGNYFQVVAQAVLPSSLPQVLSWILYMIEMNIRAATLVGVLTGSGIGFMFERYYKNLQYDSMMLLVLLLVAVVLLIEMLSNFFRRQEL